jgi:inosose dehydratase
MTRREWLLLVGGCAPGLARADDPPTRLPLGFSLYGMKSLRLADAIRICAEIGYDGVELALMPGWPAEPKELTAADRKTLRGQLADAKLALHGLMENLVEPATDVVHQGNLDRLKAAAELGHTLTPGGPVVIETILGNRPADWEQVKGRLVERLGAWAAIGKGAKAVIAVKAHVANALHTVADAAWVVKQVNSPWLRLAFDHSHFALRGVKPADAVSALAPLAAFVHVKDAKGTAEKFEFLLPGDGTTDYPTYAKLLVAAGYRGPVVVEVSGMISNRAGYDPVAAARRCFANLVPAFGVRSR